MIKILLMKTCLTLLLIFFIPKISTSQPLEISLSLDSCLELNNDFNSIEIIITNLSTKDYWVDIYAFDFNISKGASILNSNGSESISFFYPQTKKGLLRVKSSSKIILTMKTSIFNNYTLNKKAEYQLNGYYINPRKRLFRRILDQSMNIVARRFSICDS